MEASAFFSRLGEMAERDSSVVAILRRSVSFEPGSFAQAFPIVEPLLYGQPEWQRRDRYLVAGLWALGQRRAVGATVTLERALRRLRSADDGSSVEKRFVALLDSDADELPYRLRQAVGLVTTQLIAVDWPQLLEDVNGWHADSRFVQRRWARAFWESPPRGESPDAVAETPIATHP